MTRFQRARALLRRIATACKPSATAWRGATIGLYVFATSILALYFVVYVLQDFAWQKLPAFVVAVGFIVIAGLLALLGLRLLSSLPRPFLLVLLIAVPFPLLSIMMGSDVAKALFGISILLVVSCVGAGVALLRERGDGTARQKGATALLVVGILGGLGGLYAIFSTKSAANPQLENFVLEDRTLDLPNPGLAGEYSVLMTSYGSGNDRHRDEFSVAADLVARTIDGSKLIDNWDGFSGWLRTSYWGFDASNLPLQARVWYPEGNEQYPLVLIVHGNHSMEDFSDPGYAYLGEHFASRGVIFASVDENFLNSSYSARVNLFQNRPGLKEENDARGWLLLKHLSQWRDWNSEPGNLFYQKVDMDRVALIGHSRGGEAVGIAAAFNRLDRYPDDASVGFDFDFGLRGVIAIAPVYGQYQPRERYSPITDVNYFTVHGDMDGDVQSFEGMAQYSRVTFSNKRNLFKSGLYVVGANHGQFNTTWGNKDTSWFRSWALDLGAIMDGEAQRQVARVYFGAFMEIVLRDNDGYRPMFRDARYAASWLPDTFYINQYAASDRISIADFEEDIDPTTSSLPGGTLSASNLSRWYEKANELKSDDLDTHSVVVAWDDRFSGEIARLDLSLPDDFVRPVAASILSFSISALSIDTLPDHGEHDSDSNVSALPADDAATDESKPLDWTIRITDRSGRAASIPLSYDSPLYAQIKAIPRRAQFLDATDATEVLFRRFDFPLDEFTRATAELDLSQIKTISLVFDRSKKGAIIVDDISLATLQ